MRHKQNDERFPKSLIKVKTTKHCQGHPRPIMQMCWIFSRGASAVLPAVLPGDTLAASQAPAQRCVPGSMWRQSRAGSPGKNFVRLNGFATQALGFCKMALISCFLIRGREHAFRVQLLFSGAKGKVQWTFWQQALQHLETSASKQMTTPVLAASTFLHRYCIRIRSLLYPLFGRRIPDPVPNFSHPHRQSNLHFKFNLPHHHQFMIIPTNS